MRAILARSRPPSQAPGSDELVARIYLATSFGENKLLREISNNDVARLVAKRRAEHTVNLARDSNNRRKAEAREPKLVSPARVNRSVTEPLRKLLRRATEIWGEPTQKIQWKDHLLEEPSERIRELSADEERRLWSALPRQYQAIVSFSIRTGCRVNECVKLKWSDIDWDAQVFTVHGKRGKVSVLPLPADVERMLHSLNKTDVLRVFTYENGQPMTYSGLDSAFGRAILRAGISDLRFHDLRHTAATRMARATGNLKLVQTLLRHADIKTTARYAHATTDDLRIAMEKVAAGGPVKHPVTAELGRKKRVKSS